ncbi:N-acetyltransferase DgcN [Geminicoccaceae bacterium 1502E]|nr:N-acetyltransferase DgcN [Geminicoccaceae bacterium 1502E]
MQPPYLLFLGDVHDQLAAKTAHGIKDWRPEHCFGQLRLEGCVADLGLREATIAEAKAAGCGTMIIAVANSGGTLAPHWAPYVIEALEAGMDVASGLHQRLADFPEIVAAAEKNGRQLFDVRHPKQRFKTGTGVKRTGKRLLMVGTDCSCGKKYSALAIEKEMRARGLAATFRGTGQTGVMISGGGVAIDAVVADFIAGAAEWLSPDNDPDHWDIVEGQGSLFHPAFAGVTMGLIHGTQPDGLVLCHEPTRTHMRALKHQPLPGLKECLEANLWAARLTNKDVRAVGVSVDTHNVPALEREDVLKRIADELGLPAVDPMVEGPGAIVDRLW